jgi:type II secretory pathway component PulK
VNINTVSSELLRDLLELNGFEQTVADEILYRRDANGVASLMDLSDIAGMTPERIEQLAGLVTTTSNVYTISSRGRSRASGMEVEMIVVVDRSSLPVRILEYREQ